MLKRLFFVLVFFILIHFSFGQVAYCGFDLIRKSTPDYKQTEEKVNQQLYQQAVNQSAYKTTTQMFFMFPWWFILFINTVPKTLPIPLWLPQLIS